MKFFGQQRLAGLAARRRRGRGAAGGAGLRPGGRGAGRGRAAADAAPRPRAAAAAAAPAAAAAAPAAEAAPPPRRAQTVDKGDTTWMLVSTVLVLLMIMPGLALFYGGLVRQKNMLSMLMQVSTVDRHRHDGLGALGLQPGLHRRRRPRQVRRRRRPAVPEGRHAGLHQRRDLLDRRLHPRAGLHRLPDDLRLHHRRPGAGRRGRADEVRRRAWSSRSCGRCSPTIRWPTWSGGGPGRDARRRRADATPVAGAA